MVTPLQILNAIRGITIALSDSVVALKEIQDELNRYNSGRNARVELGERIELGCFTNYPNVVICCDQVVAVDTTLVAGKWRIVAEKVD